MIIYHPHTYINNDLVFEDEKVEVRSVVLQHRIPCSGFVFKEKPAPANISKEIIHQYRLTVDQIVAIKAGADHVLKSGEVIPNKRMLATKQKPRSYAFCSDTIYDEGIVEYIKGVDLLYHESTFLHDMETRAKETYHTTALQAGMIAQKAGVKKLMIGHYSARYKDLKPLLEEARSVFSNTVLAIEGESTVLEQNI
jgi:ribonuclease Z